MSVGQLASRGLGAIRLLAIAYLLPQTELGLFGIALIVIELVERLSQTGMRQALIQNPNDIEEQLGTAWISQMVRGLLLTGVILVTATWAENFFEKPGVASLLTVLAFYPLIQGVQNIGLVFLHRELRFKKIVAMNIGTTVTDLCVSVALAFFWPVAMSLVIGRICASVMTVLLSFLLETRHAKFGFSAIQFRNLYRFGFWIFVSSILSFIMIRGGDILIGKLLSLEDMAVYQVAYGLVSVPILAIMRVIQTTTFSAYSRIQHEPNRLAEAFLRVFALSSYVAVYSIVAAVAIGDDFVAFCLKPEYAAAAAILPFLAVWAACRALGSTNTVLFQAIGRPAFATIFQLLMVVMFIGLVPITIAYKLPGVAIGLAVIGFTAQICRYIALSYVTNASLKQVALRIVVPVGAGLVALLVARGCFNLIDNQFHLLRLIVGLTVLTAVYGIATLTIDRKFGFGITDFVLSKYPAIGKKLPYLRGKSRSAVL